MLGQAGPDLATQGARLVVSLDLDDRANKRAEVEEMRARIRALEERLREVQRGLRAGEFGEAAARPLGDELLESRGGNTSAGGYQPNHFTYHKASQVEGHLVRVPVPGVEPSGV